MTNSYKYWAAILKGRCPACFKGKIYQGMLRVKDQCPSCGYDLSKSDVGDGAAYIGICIVGTLVVLLAVWLEFAYMPPLWLHVILWLPVTIIGTIVILKLAKTWLIHAQYCYRHKEN